VSDLIYYDYYYLDQKTLYRQLNVILLCVFNGSSDVSRLSESLLLRHSGILCGSETQSKIFARMAVDSRMIGVTEAQLL